MPNAELEIASHSIWDQGASNVTGEVGALDHDFLDTPQSGLGSPDELIPHLNTVTIQVIQPEYEILNVVTSLSFEALPCIVSCRRKQRQ